MDAAAGDQLNDARDIVHIDFSLGPQLGATPLLISSGQGEHGRNDISREEEDCLRHFAHRVEQALGGDSNGSGTRRGSGRRRSSRNGIAGSTAEYERITGQKRTPDEIGASVAAGIVGGELGVSRGVLRLPAGLVRAGHHEGRRPAGGHEDKERWVSPAIPAARAVRGQLARAGAGSDLRTVRGRLRWPPSFSEPMADSIPAERAPPISKVTLVGVGLFVAALAVLLIFFVPSAEPEVAPEETDPAKIYVANCAVCHGPFGEGKGAFPRIIGTKLTEAEVAERIRDGKGEMPAFRRMTQGQVELMAKWVKGLGGAK